MLIPRLPFRRLVKEVAHEFKNDIKFQSAAVEAIQEGSEDYLREHLENSNLIGIHAKRVTILQKDEQLDLRLRGIEKPKEYCNLARQRMVERTLARNVKTPGEGQDEKK